MSRKLSIFFLMFLIYTNSFAMNDEEGNKGSITGIVRTSDNEPAGNITIQLISISKSVITDENGNYSIQNIPPGNYTVVASFVGYDDVKKTVEIKAKKNTVVNFELQATAKELGEVIVFSSNKYKSNQSNYVSKMPLANLENAQSYSVITKGLIKDQVLFTVDDALRNVSGMQKMWDATGRAGDGGAYYDLRGFPSQVTMRNGLASMITGTTDAANIEKIEVLKGPSATLYGSALTTYGGLINRVTKKPYDYFGGEVNISGGGYDFFRVSADINTPVDKEGKFLFRINSAYTTEKNFQKGTGAGNRIFVAPGLLIQPNKKLSISLDAELTYAKTTPSQFFFLYYTAADLGFDNAAFSGLDYNNPYVGKVSTTSNSTNFYGNATYKISDKITSFTNVSYSRSFSNGHNQYFFQVPNYLVTGNPDDIGTPSIYLARSDQSTRNSSNNIFQAQQYFNGEFNIGKLKNRAVFGLDFTYINSKQNFTSANYIDIVPTNVKGFDYSTFDNALIEHFYDTASADLIQNYPINSKTAVYSAFVSDVVNITDKLEAIAALRLDHYYNHDIDYSTTYNQTTLSPKFGLVYQPIKDQVSLFANYQNSFTNQGSYIAFDPSATDSLASKFARPEQANQWEAGIKTNLIRNRLTATFSYYNIKVDDALRTDPRAPGKAQIQNGTQLSRGVELEITSNPVGGLTIFGAVSYNNFGYENMSDDMGGYRYSGAPWLANWWLNYQFSNRLKGLHIGFGGNYASTNKLMDSKATGVFALPAYTVLNASVGYDAKNYSIAVKVDNITNEHYWQGYTTYNPQKLRQVVGSVSFKF